MPLLFWSDLFLEARAESKNIFVLFLVQMKTLKFAFEINWPLTRKFQIVKGPFWNNIHSYFYSYKSPRSWCKCCNYYWQQWCKWRIVCFNDWRYHRKTCWYTDCLSLRKKWVRYLILFLHKFLFDCRLFGLIRGNFFYFPIDNTI